MSDNNGSDNLDFDLPKNQSSVIKVIGVGGGGSNAVNHMYGLGLKDIDFCVCNTDSQALENSPVPNKIQLGISLTEGLGAGANPEVGEESAQESIDDIKNLLNSNTKMVFITAGMGGGTGTGAAPVIAKTAKDLGILTVGIVTIPFVFEGSNRKVQADKGVDELRNSVDALVVINNNKLREVYGNLGFKAGFAKADEVLATAARGIAEVITHHYTANIDLRDAKTVLADSGTAIMGAANARGENRAQAAITGALDSPLLNDNHIRGAKNVLLLIVSGKEEITIDEIGEINEYIQLEAGGKANIIMGIGDNEELGDEIAVTVVATGFNAEQQENTIGRAPDRVIHTLEDEQQISHAVYNKPLTLDEEDEDVMLDLEIAKARKKEAQTHEDNQAELFAEIENPTDFSEIDEPLKDEVEESTKEIEGEEEENRTVFSLEEDEEIVETKSEELSVETTGQNKDNDEIEEASTEDYNLEPQLKTDINPNNKAPEEDSEETLIGTNENVDSNKGSGFTLEDYSALEERLNNASPEDEPSLKSLEANADNESVENTVGKTNEPETRPALKRETVVRKGKINPINFTIEESMKLKAEERRAQLKAFNYRFKNSSSNSLENEPAYKRHGVEIDNEKHSTKNSQSRFSINDNDGQSDIKTNNSFLHDNVD